MNNKIQSSIQEQGSQELTPAKVEKYLKHDLAVAINCLQAIHDDPDLLVSMATFMHGRMVNYQNAKAAKEAQVN